MASPCNYGVEHNWRPIAALDTKRTIWQCMACKNIGEGRPADPLEVTVKSIEPPRLVMPKAAIGAGIAIIAPPVG